MAEYKATIEWQLAGEFRYETYSRSHSIDFGRGIRLAGNAAADNIPKTVAAAAGVDPEQQFAQLHEKTHQRCFIANSVKTEIVLEPRIA